MECSNVRRMTTQARDCNHTANVPWVSILPESSSMAARAWQAVEDISQSLLRRNYPPLMQLQRNHQLHEDSLLFAYLALASENVGWANHATDCLNLAIDQAPELRHYSGLYGGLCGLGWTVEHVSSALGSSDLYPPNLEASEADDEEDSDLNDNTDAHVLNAIESGPWLNSYDLISGLVGFGVYFLERLPAEAAVRGLTCIVDHLEATSEQVSDGITWHSGPELLPEWQRHLCPDGYYNLGVAHGIPGILYLLSETAAARIEIERCSELLDGGVRWLMKQQRPPGSVSRFSGWIAPGYSSDSRLAWCYGDLGILAIMLHVARRTERKEWLAFANELLEHCLGWPADKAGVNDAALCHGTAGIAHIFNRIYQAGGDLRCRDAAVAWFEQTLALRKPGTGVGGYLSYTKPTPEAPPVWESNPTFLDGALGIALALISAMTSIDPQWDRLLAISGRGLDSV